MMNKFLITLATSSLLVLFLSSTSHSRVLYMSDYGLDCGGDSIATIVSGVAAKKVSIVVDCISVSVTNNITIPANVDLIIPHDHVFSVSAGVTFTINGHIVAGQWVIFSGAGNVAGTGSAELSYHTTWDNTSGTYSFTTPGATALDGGTVIAAGIADDAITADHIAAGGIVTAGILDRTILPVDISAGSITVNELNLASVMWWPIFYATSVTLTNVAVATKYHDDSSFDDSWETVDLDNYAGTSTLTNRLVLLSVSTIVADDKDSSTQQALVCMEVRRESGSAEYEVSKAVAGSSGGALDVAAYDFSTAWVSLTSGNTFQLKTTSDGDGTTTDRDKAGFAVKAVGYIK